MEMSEREQFFYDHAGCSYRPDVETADEGRRRGAAEMAAAEAAAAERGWSVRWSDDWEVGSHRAYYGPDSAYADSEPETCETALLVDEAGRVLASLGCVDDADDDYRRVVAAELALEVLGEEVSA